MQLNLADPDSILAWWRVLPDRHSDYLDYQVKTSPEFAPAIKEAQRRIASDDELRALLATAVEDRNQREAEQARRKEHLSSLQLRHLELATA